MKSVRTSTNIKQLFSDSSSDSLGSEMLAAIYHFFHHNDIGTAL